MRAVITRVSDASVEIGGEKHAEIGRGFLILLGVSARDTAAEAERLAKKIAELRVFSDAQGMMNLSCASVGGEMLVVSNFTLYADARRGTRPGFTDAARAETAEPLYEYFTELLRNYGYRVKTGVFGADMALRSTNDGPVTILMDSDAL